MKFLKIQKKCHKLITIVTDQKINQRGNERNSRNVNAKQNHKSIVKKTEKYISTKRFRAIYLSLQHESMFLITDCMLKE